MGTSTVDTVDGVAVRGKGVMGTATVDSRWSGSNGKKERWALQQSTVNEVAATQKGAMGTATVDTVNVVAATQKGAMGTATVNSRWSGSNAKWSDGHCNS
jgi:hypothetical protein